MSMAFAHAQASIVLHEDGAGILTGATGVYVAGVAYDVSFEDGTCSPLLPACNRSCYPAMLGSCVEPPAFSFTSIQTATQASEALFAQVLMGRHNELPDTVAGCELSPSACQIHTPYFTDMCVLLHESLTFHCLFYSVVADNWNPLVGSDAIFEFVGKRGFPHAFAVWSLQSNDVPEPSSISILALAMLALGFIRSATIFSKLKKPFRLDGPSVWSLHGGSPVQI